MEKRGMAKAVFVIILTGILASVSHAQHGILSFENGKVWLKDIYLDDHYYGADSVGVSQVRADYAVRIMVDTVQGIVVEQLAALEAGKAVSRFCTVAYKSLDSMLKSSNSTKSLILSGKGGYIRSQIKYSPSFYSMYFQNYPRQGKLTCTGRVCNTDFKYEEDLPEMDWVIHGNTDTLLGYAVQKATCCFRGREYEAWFASGLPLSSGPWKFSGLPGLILKVSDSKGHYSFTAEAIYRGGEAIEIPSYLYLKTTRDKYMEAVLMSMTEQFKAANLYLKDIVVRPHEGTPLKEEMKFDFMEKL